MSLETCCSWLVRLLAVVADSSPVLLPQAAINETANPSPPVTTARSPLRIRGLTLERCGVGFRLRQRPAPECLTSAPKTAATARIAAVRPARPEAEPRG